MATPPLSGTTDYILPSSHLPNPDMSGLVEAARRRNYPQVSVFEDLQSRITAFENMLDEVCEVGAYIANAPVPFHVRSVLRDGALFLFEGLDSASNKVLAIQHFTQLNLQLVALPPLDEQPYRVGFVSSEER